MTIGNGRVGPVTLAIAIVTIIGYLVSGFLGPHVVFQGGFVPARVFGETPFSAVPVVFTPLTATLLHGGLLHIGFNLLMLMFCGSALERVLGGWATFGLYVAGAYGAALVQFLPDPSSSQPMIGASGAISAWLAGYAMLFARGQQRRVGPLSATVVRALWLAAAWAGIQWLVGAANGGGPVQVATAAHIGGFFTGLVLAWPLLLWRYRTA